MPRLVYDDFEIGASLGTGTVGSVYEVKHRETGRIYALKLLSQAVGADPLVRARFAREIEILSQLNHPNIVAYAGEGRYKGQLFYVMELLRGGTLKELLARSGTLTWQETAECGRQLASGLQHAHNHGIIHRDLKPGNVYLAEEGTMKLGDFGIARDLKAIDLTDTGLTVGTYAYMAPEAIRGKREITGKVDLYALGCLLFETLTGRAPYVGDNFAEIFEQHLHATPPSVCSLGIPCPETLDALIVSLLAKDPQQRPFNARNVQGRLMELIDREAQTANSASEAGVHEVDDRGAASVRQVQLALANRIQHTGEAPQVSWMMLSALAFVLVGAVALVAALGK